MMIESTECPCCETEIITSLDQECPECEYDLTH